MTWSVCDGLPNDAKGELWNYMRLKKPSYNAVIAGLDWCEPDKLESYLQHAVDEGLRLSPDQVIDLLEIWPEGYEQLLHATEGTFSFDQSVGVQELLLTFGVDTDKLMRLMGELGALFNCDESGEFDYYNIESVIEEKVPSVDKRSGKGLFSFLFGR